MTAEELAAGASAMLARLRLPLPEVADAAHAPVAARTRDRPARDDARARPAPPARVAPLALRARTRRTPPLVVLCDISGSMDRYARMLLHFLHAITNDRHRVHVLLFGTRLTNVTRHLKHRDVDVALARVAGGGRRLGRRHAHRRVARGVQPPLVAPAARAERGRAADQRRARRRGGRGARRRDGAAARSRAARLVWLNPLLRYAGFEARPGGHPRDAAVRRRLPAGAQPRLARVAGRDAGRGRAGARRGRRALPRGLPAGGSPAAGGSGGRPRRTGRT